MKPNIEIVMAAIVTSLVMCTGESRAQYKQINLVSDKQGMARYTDPNLVNPWGLAFLPEDHFLIANAFSGLSTAYGPHGKPSRLTVTVPAAPGLPSGTLGTPTGLIANPTGEFMISKNGKSGPALFLFDTLDGTISGWNPNVDANNAVIAIDNSTEAIPASYTALALARNSKGQTVLYAADSGGSPTASNNRIDMYDGAFNYLGSFGDPTPPTDMTVFGIQNVKDKLYVTYAAFTALQGGAVDVFDTDGNLLERFATNGPSGPLEEPWAVTVAPGDFGEFGHALLVGNFGDGRINAFNGKAGRFLGQLADKDGNPLSSGLGLWALAFRNDHAKDERARLFFTSGINDENGGLFGAIIPMSDDEVSHVSTH